MHWEPPHALCRKVYSTEAVKSVVTPGCKHLPAKDLMCKKHSIWELWTNPPLKRKVAALLTTSIYLIGGSPMKKRALSIFTRWSLLVTLAGLLSAPSARAQGFDNRPLRFTVTDLGTLG